MIYIIENICLTYIIKKCLKNSVKIEIDVIFYKKIYISMTMTKPITFILSINIQFKKKRKNVIFFINMCVIKSYFIFGFIEFSINKNIF